MGTHGGCPPAQHGEATTSTVHEVEGAMTIAVNWRGPLQACERSIDPGPATVKLGQIHLLLNRAALAPWLACAVTTVIMPGWLSSSSSCRHAPSLTVSSHHHELGGDADCHKVLAKPSLLEMDAHRAGWLTGQNRKALWSLVGGYAPNQTNPMCSILKCFNCPNYMISWNYTNIL
jgi:hypothetical protein